MLPNVLEVVRRLIRERVGEGEVVVDATMGNGNDTLFLAQLVGETGKVIAYDIQPHAVQKTRLRLEREQMLDWVDLRLASHEEMGQITEPVSAIMFNLGYLPGGDRDVTTQAKSTLVAMEAGLDLLRSGGLMTIVIYLGHPEGETEREVLEAYCQQLDLATYFVLKYQYINQQNHAPYILAIEKR